MEPLVTPSRRLLLATALAAAVPVPAFARQVGLAAEADHARLLRLLGIDALRPGADGWTPGAPNAPNYDERRAEPFPDMPELLRLEDGRPVQDAKTWRVRRLEILNAFETEVYGRVPPGVPQVRWTLSSPIAEQVGSHAVQRRRLSGRLDDRLAIAAELVAPAGATKAPVVLALTFPKALTQRFPPEPGAPWTEQILARGWAYVEYDPLSVQADDGAGLASGAVALSLDGQPRGLTDWGALRAWAWGASRVLDALVQTPEADPEHASIYGLSRYGKAALLAMATDERFAAGFIASSGAGGAKLLRRDFGERVENLASSGEYHWMAGAFLKYAGPLTPGDLPVDAHQLIALCAPRPVFVSVGSPDADRWTDPTGMFKAAVAAGPAYALLGARPLAGDAYPPLGTLVDGDLAFRQHEGGHTGGPNWPVFLDWLTPKLGAHG